VKVGHRAALPYAAPKPAAGQGEAYDPGDHTVAEVIAYAAEHPDQLDDIEAAETSGKARSTLLAGLEAMS
jgi:hypothetical protein